MSIQEFLQDLNMEIVVNVILFLAGLILGNWLAIGRDKRKEFNEAADEVHFELKKQKEQIKSGRALKRGPEDKQLEKLKRRVPFYRQKSFNESLEKYFNATSSDNWKQDGYGDTSYEDTEKVIDSINNLIQFTERK
ncbi:hypothetical protein LQ318_16085 [Aliifodinibius salicampi]|uniref:Uncharacterized protein n=1 Tax=Fodinibius salicampi TaxID=1920655 RepID=A0ABT3Q2X3_9BACT|nr:hypothetical protein [Fodinibius salicampi]MCW9714426.1 hypothetical protein [Fodinibius salicampi]